MTRIRILPEILSNKIAAGEVVERPASVVKELVENALDAEGSRIVVEVERGGRSLIRVGDDGMGMGRDDALLALERYATSKIYENDDLFAIRTLGFRGEALPSIAAVSRFSLVTRERDAAEVGTEILVDGGKIRSVADTGAPPGTLVTVRQLFFNTPARRKFLKTIATEMGHIADTLAGTALAWPDVQFRLLHNGKPVKHWARTDDPGQRVADVLGAEVTGSLGRIDLSGDDVSVTGWAVSPRLNRSSTAGIYTFVNGRCVKDRTIRHALLEGYAGRLMKGRYPLAVVSLRVPCDQVDVNVHPTKHEVRFARQREVHDAVRRAVAEGLRRFDPGRRPHFQAEADAERDAGVDALRDASLPERFRPQQEERTWHFRVAEGPPSGVNRRTESVSTVSDPSQPAPAPLQDPAQAPQRPLWEREGFSQLRYIGQFRNAYLVCESDDGLVLLDQHAAHERILYERLRRGRTGDAAASQRLLVPETVEFSHREAAALEKLVADFDRLGMEIEPFGGTAFVVRAVPAVLAEAEVAPLIREIVEKAVETEIAGGAEAALEASLKIMACHGAIRASQRLEEVQVRELLAALDTCDNPSHCPHGRPTWIQWSRRELEKRFGRVV